MKADARTAALLAGITIASSVFLLGVSGSAAGQHGPHARKARNGSSRIGEAGAAGASELESAGAGGEDDGANTTAQDDTKCPQECLQNVLEELTRCVEQMRGCALDAQQRYDTAKNQLDQATDGGSNDAARAKEFAASRHDLVSQNQHLQTAEDRLVQLKERHSNAKTWQTGIALEGHLGLAAGDVGLAGVDVPFTLRSSSMFELELRPGLDFVDGLDGDPHQTYWALRGDVGFLAAEGTSVTFGVGGATRGEIARDSMLLIPLALRHRFNNDLGAHGQTFISELSFFAEPWIPLNGRETAVFFGFGISAGGGFNRLGPADDLCLSQDDPNRGFEKKCPPIVTSP